MKLDNKLVVFALLCQLALSWHCYAESGKLKFKNLNSLDIPSEVEFFDEEGNKKFLEQFDNKTILLVFWATWCSACVKEMPELDMLQKDFRKLPFEVIAVSEDFQGIGAVQKYFKAQQIRYLKMYHDYQNKLFKAFSVVGLPTSFLINHDGKIMLVFSGEINWYDEEIRQTLLSYIPGNYPAPRNSYQPQPITHLPQNAKNKDDSEAKQGDANNTEQSDNAVDSNSKILPKNNLKNNEQNKKDE